MWKTRRHEGRGTKLRETSNFNETSHRPRAWQKEEEGTDYTINETTNKVREKGTEFFSIVEAVMMRAKNRIDNTGSIVWKPSLLLLSHLGGYNRRWVHGVELREGSRILPHSLLRSGLVVSVAPKKANYGFFFGRPGR